MTGGRSVAAGMTIPETRITRHSPRWAYIVRHIEIGRGVPPSAVHEQHRVRARGDMAADPATETQFSSLPLDVPRSQANYRRNQR
jgi:hypothetical protein